MRYVKKLFIAPEICSSKKMLARLTTWVAKCLLRHLHYQPPQWTPNYEGVGKKYAESDPSSIHEPNLINGLFLLIGDLRELNGNCLVVVNKLDRRFCYLNVFRGNYHFCYFPVYQSPTAPVFSIRWLKAGCVCGIVNFSLFLFDYQKLESVRPHLGPQSSTARGPPKNRFTKRKGYINIDYNK
jgi:hypothetical protein